MKFQSDSRYWTQYSRSGTVCPLTVIWNSLEGTPARVRTSRMMSGAVFPWKIRRSWRSVSVQTFGTRRTR